MDVSGGGEAKFCQNIGCVSWCIMDIKRNCCALLLMAVFFFSGMGLLSANQFSRMERIGTEKDVTVADKMRAKAMGFVIFCSVLLYLEIIKLLSCLPSII